MRILKALALVAVALGFCFAGTSQAQVALPASAGTIQIGEQGGWDALEVDTAAHRLYVSHSTRVNVIDLDQNKMIKEIPNTARVHDIAIAYDLGRGFISDGGDSTVTVFDLKSDSTLAVVKVTGANPDAILYDPFTHRVFAFNGRSNNATVIDGKSLKILETIPLDGKPEFAVSDLKGKVYVNIEDKSSISQIDASKMKVLTTWSIAPCEEPSGLAIDRKNHRLFAAGGNKLMAIVDADKGKVITTIPIGDHVDGAAFDPATNLIYSSNGEGTLTVIKEESPNKFTVVGNATTERGARTIALDERTHLLYLPLGSRPDSTGVAKEDFRVLIFK